MGPHQSKCTAAVFCLSPGSGLIHCLYLVLTAPKHWLLTTVFYDGNKSRGEAFKLEAQLGLESTVCSTSRPRVGRPNQNICLQLLPGLVSEAAECRGKGSFFSLLGSYPMLLRGYTGCHFWPCWGNHVVLGLMHGKHVLQSIELSLAAQ